MPAQEIIPSDIATEPTLAALAAKTPTAIVDMPGQDTPSAPVRIAPQKYVDISFSQVGAGLVSPELTLIRTGSGQSVNQSGGNLVITTGTTVNAETLIRSVANFNGALTLRQVTTLSQRIANQNFFVELCDVLGDNLAYAIVNATTVDVTLAAHGFTAANVGQRIDLCALSSVGVPMAGVIASIPNADTIRFTVAGWPASGSGTLSLTGWSKVELLYTGTVATVVAFNTRRRGWENAATSPTVATTAAAHMLHLNVDNGVASLGHKTTAAAQAIANVSAWETNIPLPSEDMFLQIKCRNGTGAPASTTSWTLGMVRVEDYTAAQVNITATRQQSIANAQPVNVIGTVSVSGSVTAAVANASIASGTVSPLTVAGVSVESSAARVASANGTTITNASARGGVFFFNISLVSGTTPTIVFQLQVQDPVTTNWVDVPGAATATLNAAGLVMLTVNPGIAEVANSRVNNALPRVYRWRWTIGGTTPSFTFSVGVAYII
jgi:hypothetical protein